jgi:mono/diheme cytochrome c family protein
MNRVGWTFALILTVSVLVSATTPSKGNPDKGRTIFRQTCKNCHSKGGAGGEITPLNMTAGQWRSYFDKGKHARGTLLQVMSEQNLRDVQVFLVAHAVDSEHPETCGR